MLFNSAVTTAEATYNQVQMIMYYTACFKVLYSYLPQRAE
jgi:hypothetical protein